MRWPGERELRFACHVQAALRDGVGMRFPRGDGLAYRGMQAAVEAPSARTNL